VRDDKNQFELENMDKTLKHAKILGVKVSITNESEVTDFVLSSLKRRKFFIVTPNPEIVVAAQKDKELRTVLNAADVALPDGTGLLLASKLLNLGINERITGREIFEQLLSIAGKKKLKVYLLGASQSVNKLAIAKAKKKYKGIKIEGSADIYLDKEGYSVTYIYRKKHIVIKDYTSVIKHINRFKPDILFVALGAPKQEKWVMHNLDKLNVGGAMVVGGALDYFTGKMVKPPSLVSGLGLEWLWRGFSEPARLPRIINAVIVFPLLVLKSKLVKD